MPLDDLSLTVPPSGPHEPPLEVMTRVLRLPTRSVRQARSIVRLQLDRLSPLPPEAVVFDLVPLRTDGAETVFALGLVRRTVLSTPGLATKSVISAVRTLDGTEVTFRFRNPEIAAEWETRWLTHAPKALLLALGVCAVLLAGQIRAEAWRQARLPEIAAERRAAARAALDARDIGEAREAWSALNRSDAATRFLCVTARARSAFPDGIATGAITATADRVAITLTKPLAPARAVTLGGVVDSAPPSGNTLIFPAETCA